MRAWLVAAVIVAGCSKSEGYKSNFASVRVEDAKILDAKSNAPYSGTLIARDKEIDLVARETLGDAYKRMAGSDLTGLVLVMPVEKGAPSGRTTLYVDFNAPRLNAEIARRSDEALAVARVGSGTIKLAEATFKAGKLDGTAIVYGPSSTGMTKVAEVQFKDHLLHGPAIELYPGTKQVKRELHFEAGARVGPYRNFHANGKLQSAGTYVADRPDGEFEVFYANGATHAKGKLANGDLVAYESWFPNGQKQATKSGDTMQEWRSNGQPVDAPANGVVEEFHDTGEVHTRTTYVEGTKHGPFQAHYANGGKWKAGTYAQGNLHGRYQEWWKNGKPALDATYVNGQYEGAFKRWYANGKDWESATYVGGKLDGPYRKWWKNGKPAHVYAYKAGKLDGDYQQNYDNGAKWVRAKYALGKPQGAIERWYPNGTLGYVMNHKDGRPDGPYKRWYANGKPRLEATHVNGALDGDFKNWLEDGTLYEQATYARGVKTQTTRPETQR